MGASDYMVGNAPAGASYAAPLVGQFLGEQLSKLPQDYFQGQQNRRTLELQKPILGPDGQPTTDFNTVTQELLRRGGGEYAQTLVPFLMQREQGRDLSQAAQSVDSYVSGGQGPQPPAGANTGARTSTNATGPGNVTARPQVSAPAQAGPPGSAPAKVQAQPTILKILQAQGIPNDQWEAAAASIGRQIAENGAPPVGPTDPIDLNDPRVAGIIGPAISQLKRMGIGQVVPPGAAQPAAQTIPQQGGQPPQAGAPAPGAQQPGSTAPIQPRQVQTQPVSPMGAQAAAAPSRGPVSPNDVEDVPGTDDATISRLRGAAAFLRAKAAGMVATNPAAAAAMENMAKSYDARAESAFQYRAKGVQTEHEHALSNQDLTPNEKDASNPAVAAAKENEKRNDLNVVRWDKDQQSYFKIARQADEARPQLAMAQKLVNTPGFISGSGQPFRDTLANVATSLGLAHNAPINQIFDKIRAGGILDQIKSMAGTGPVRVAEMKFIDTMMAGRENQPDALRAVLNIQDRLYQRAQDIRYLIRQNGGNINKDVEGKIDDLVNSQALFTPQEMKDPRLLGAPTFNSPQELKASGLKHGSPFKTADGRIKYVP